MAKTLVQRYETIVRLIRIFSGICGANIFNPAFKKNILTWIVIIFIYQYFVFTGYTLYVKIYIDKDRPSILQVLCYLGSAVQVSGMD